MAHGHPVDEQGRTLPDSGWPSDKAAPGPLDVIRRFCNTRNCENGADALASAAGLDRWLRVQGLPTVEAGADDLDRIVAFREHLRAHAVAHHDRTPDPDLYVELGGHVRDVALAVRVEDGRLEPAAARSGAANLVIATVVIAVIEAQRTGTWQRFKACRHCRWVFYDRSKNQSGRWCSMRACGGRAKVAAYRRRKRS